MWLFWPRHFLSALLLAAKRDWIAHTSERSHVVSPRRSHTHSRCQNKKGRKSDRGSVALLPFSWSENIKQPSHPSDCFSKCLSVWDFHLLDGGFILEELLMLFNCLSQAELPGLQWQRSIAHSKTEVVYFVRHLTRTHMHAHTHWPIDPLTPFEEWVNAYFGVAGSLQDYSVWQQCACIDLIPSSCNDSAHLAIVYAARDYAQIYSCYLQLHKASL